MSAGCGGSKRCGGSGGRRRGSGFGANVLVGKSSSRTSSSWRVSRMWSSLLSMRQPLTATPRISFLSDRGVAPHAASSSGEAASIVCCVCAVFTRLQRLGRRRRFRRGVIFGPKEPWQNHARARPAWEDIARTPKHSETPVMDPSPSLGSVAIEVRSSVDALRRSQPAADVLEAIKTLAKLAQNLVEHPADPKRHRVRIQNAAFFSKVGRMQDACAVMEAMGFRASVDGDFYEAEMGVGGCGLPDAVADVLLRSVDEVKADLMEEEARRLATQQALAERRKRKKNEDERWSQAWSIAGMRLGQGHWGGGLGGVQQSLPRHSSGYVGLCNQGATCYLNSLLQCLYHNAFLRTMLGAELEDSSDGTGSSSKFLGGQLSASSRPSDGTSIPAALQRLFHRMTHDTATVDTKGLTNAFGWTGSDAATQQDAHETLLLLLHAVESTLPAGDAKQLNDLMGFVIEYRVSFTAADAANGGGAGEVMVAASSTLETNLVLSLDLVTNQPVVLGSTVPEQRQRPRTVSGALEKLVETEVMEGENAYDAGPEFGGLQSKAFRECRIVGTSLPPVLFASISRFTIDRTKDNSHLSVEPLLDLRPFLATDLAARAGAAGAATPVSDLPCCTYELTAVMVHAGNNAVRVRQITYHTDP